MVFSEYLTKWVEAFPVPSIEAPVIARLPVDEIFTSLDELFCPIVEAISSPPS